MSKKEHSNMPDFQRNESPSFYEQEKEKEARGKIVRPRKAVYGLAVCAIILIVSLASFSIYSVYKINTLTERLEETDSAESAERDTVEFKYVASKNSDKYHLCSCNYAAQISVENCVYYETMREAENDGKEPCSVCLSEEDYGLMIIQESTGRVWNSDGEVTAEYWDNKGRE